MPRMLSSVDFAGPRGPHDGDKLAFFDIERDAAQDKSLSVTGFVELLDVVQSNQWFHGLLIS